MIVQLESEVQPQNHTLCSFSWYNAIAPPEGPSYRAEVTMIQRMVLVLSVLGSYVVVISDEVNLTATIPPGYALQDYLCSGALKSNRVA